MNIRDLPPGSYKVIQPGGSTRGTTVSDTPIGPKKLTLNELKKQEEASKKEASKSTFKRFFGELGKNADNLVSPFTKAAGTGVRALESIPQVIAGDARGALETQKKPMFGQNTFPGSSIKQNLGSAAEAASYLVGGSAVGKAAGKVVGPAIRSGAAAGALGAGGNYVANAENPTVKGAVGNTLLGAAVGGALGGAFAAGTKKLVTKTSPQELADSWEVVKPKLNIRQQADAIANGNVVVQKGTTKLLPQQQQALMRNLAADAGVSSKNNPIQNISLLKQAIRKSDDHVREGLKHTTAGNWTHNELKDTIYKEFGAVEGKNGLTFSKLPTRIVGDSEKVARKLIRATEQLSLNANKKAIGIIDVRQQFDDIIEAEFPPTIWDGEDPMSLLILRLRQSLNKFAESKLPSGKVGSGFSLREELKNQSLMFDAIKNIAQKAPKEGYSIGTTAIQRFGQKHPLLKKAAPYILGGGITGTGVGLGLGAGR